MRRFRLVGRPGAWLVWGGVAFFFINLAGLIASVVVSSFGTRWLDSWLPADYTTRWYGEAWDEFALLDVLVDHGHLDRGVRRRGPSDGVGDRAGRHHGEHDGEQCEHGGGDRGRRVSGPVDGA